ncbi:MAG: hypothetical protein PHU69_12620 [Fermentimonas sp.]|nr:hypothetical protein [Fermentimonas sp.]
MEKDDKVITYNSSCAKVQENAAARTDTQIKSLTPFIFSALSTSHEGTIVDYGCGKGILLNRLCQISEFFKSQWNYCGVDVQEDYEEDIAQLAVGYKLRRRSEFRSVDDYSKLNINANRKNLNFPSPVMFVCRNVLHELSINETAMLLYNALNTLLANEILIIQDLYTFPSLELKHACWEPTLLTELLTHVGFTGSVLPDDTAHGNTYYTYSGTKKDSHSITLSGVEDEVYKYRKKQLELWTPMYRDNKYHNDCRDIEIAQHDFTYQYAALCYIVMEYKSIDITVSAQTDRFIFQDTVLNCYNNLLTGSLCFKEYNPTVVRFRDRAKGQDILNDFIIGVQNISIVYGSPLIGKTSLINEVVGRKKERSMIVLDFKYSSNIWNLLEEFYSSLGQKLNLQPLLQDNTALNYNDVKEIISNTIKLCASRCLVIFDHFEKVIDNNGNINNEDIHSFIFEFVSNTQAKIIVSSNIKLPKFEVSCIEYGKPVVIELKRLPTKKHVINILDDYIDRSSIHLGYYPNDLIEAIDGLPYLASLAGRIVASKGIHYLDDHAFMSDLKNKMRQELMMHLVTDVTSRLVITLSLLRIAVPMSLIKPLSSENAIAEALDKGLLYREYSFAGVVHYSGIKTFRTQLQEDEMMIDSDTGQLININQLHQELSHQFKMLFLRDKEPKWLRESHYHLICTGDKTVIEKFGVLFCDEFYDAGCEWQYRHEYNKAEYAFDLAYSYGSTINNLQIKRASVKMRVGKTKESIDLYHQIINKYPSWGSAKSSFIDSFLSVRKFDDAFNLLKTYGIGYQRSKDYVLYQFARAHLGLHQYREARDAITKALQIHSSDRYFDILMLSLRKLGQVNELKSSLIAARKEYPNNVRIAIDYASYLIHTKESNLMKEAEVILINILSDFRGEGFALKQLCKLYYLQGRKADALDVYKDNVDFIRPSWMKWTIEFEMLLSQNKWLECIGLIETNKSSNEINALCYEKKTYLLWSISLRNEDKKEIAQRGLSIPISTAYRSNIPLMVMQAKLAKLAENDAVYEETLRLIEKTNPSIASEIKQKNYFYDLLEDVFFDRNDN